MRTLRQYAVITLGIIILAVALYLFLIPNDIAAGGATGIAMLVNHFAPQLPVGSIMVGVNAVLFILAFLALGSGFGLKTVYASLGLSGAIWLLEAVYPLQGPLTHDLLLASLMGTMISGLGMALIFNEEASSGGTDIIAKILNRYFHLDIGKALLVTDAAITLGAAAIFGLEKGLYALLAVVTNGYIIDYAVQGFNISNQVMIMSDNSKAIAGYVMNELQRGVTLFQGQGGYSGKKMDIVYTVLNRREFISLKMYIRDIDPKAFISVSRAHEVLGEGFKSNASE